MTTVSFEIPDELAARLDASARARHTTRSELLREAVEKLAEEEVPKKKVSVLDLGRDLCGIIDSGITDLGSNPRHLDDFGK